LAQALPEELKRITLLLEVLTKIHEREAVVVNGNAKLWRGFQPRDDSVDVMHRQPVEGKVDGEQPLAKLLLVVRKPATGNSR
jgi:hypothetical protein